MSALFVVPSTKRAELDHALADDLVGRQSHKVREAASLGGPAGQLYVMVAGTPEGVRRAEELLESVGTRLPKQDAEELERKFREEDEAASAGMGLVFSD
ncbi:MAG TPA: hypothetical protein VGV64_03530 [Thermoplasmata archaeon]|nr:hypothetical protein [Thermoplasmata archaeon]